MPSATPVITAPFGDPEAPFNDGLLPEYVSKFSPVFQMSSYIIDWLQHASDAGEVTDTFDQDINYRSTEFNCSANLATDYELFINEEACNLGMDNFQNLVKQPLHFVVGDCATRSAVLYRWATMSRPGRESFGITGISTPNGLEGRITLWNSVTILTHSTSSPVTRVFVIDDETGTSSQLGEDIIGYDFPPVVDSFKRALGRSYGKATRGNS